MKSPNELSTLLITHEGKLISLTENDHEILGVLEEGGELGFKLRK